jgi:hypothetical protein
MNRKRFDPVLEQAIRAGLMTREEAEQVDAWSDDLATLKVRGKVSDAELRKLIEERAIADATEKLRRRRS